MSKSNTLYNNFFFFQTKLHDEICQKRQAATIATHDLKAIKRPILYDAKFPQHLMVS
jgi:arsenate reductase-like glutaredoxin family protein